MQHRGLVMMVVVVLAGARPARADDWNFPKRSYLWDGGAIPFLYVPVIGYLAVRGLYEPRDEPLMFSGREGGKHYDGGQFPTPLLYVNAAIAAGVIVIGGDDSRWFHLKGFLQGVATTQFLTAIAKSTFGRHRPSYDLGDDSANAADQSKSFWSGHASVTLATATYLGLYARGHLFDRWRPRGTLAWWEIPAYAGLAAAALAIPYSQYALHRHHASDVIVGSAVGAATSTLFYLAQEHRYRASLGRETEPSSSDRSRGRMLLERISIAPNPGINGVTVTGSW